MYNMECFSELFRQNLITQRLELRVLEPIEANAKLVWDAIKNENPANFKYVNWTPGFRRPLPKGYGLPKSLGETMTQMRQEQDYDVVQGDAAVWYVFYNGNLIGHHGVCFYPRFNYMNSGDIWFIKSAWGHGFNREIWSLIIKMAFEDLGVGTINRTCLADNERSRKSIISSGFCIDENRHVSQRYIDGVYKDVLNFTLRRGR